MNKSWSDVNILKSYNEHTPCKEIFQAVCDEIGAHYSEQGWKYARSKPKITYKNKNVKLEIAFWSSGSNIPGSYVNLEIIPSLSALDYAKEMKSKGKETKSYILGLSHLFTESSSEVPKGRKRTINLLTENTECDEEYEEKGILRYNHNINVYGIDEQGLRKILRFIDEKIISWLDRINDFEELRKLAEKSVGYGRKTLKDKEFIPFIEFKFPGRVDIIQEILK